MNNTKCVLKGILIQASGLKTVKICPFQRFPHMLDITNINNPPILDGVSFLKAGLPSLRKIQLFIPTLAFVQ